MMATRSASLDAIRGVAISLVMIGHLIVPSRPVIRHIHGLSWSGVDLFFVLSGFLIGGILIDRRESKQLFLVFYLRRAIRILPLYALLIIPFIIASGAPLLQYATFTQNFVWASEGQWGPPLVGATWSLAVEEQFYIALPFLIWLCPPKRLPFVLLPLICAAPAIRWAVTDLYQNQYAAYLLLPARMDALLLGVLAAWIIRNAASTIERNMRLVIAVFCVSLTGVVIWTALEIDAISPLAQMVGYSLIDVFYFFALLIVITRKRDLPAFLRPASWLGIGAYSLYLFHIPAQQLGLLVTNNFKANLAITILALFGASFVLWHLIEKPMIDYGHRHFKYALPAGRNRDNASIRHDDSRS